RGTRIEGIGGLRDAETRAGSDLEASVATRRERAGAIAELQRAGLDADGAGVHERPEGCAEGGRPGPFRLHDDSAIQQVEGTVRAVDRAIALDVENASGANDERVTPCHRQCTIADPFRASFDDD